MMAGLSSAADPGKEHGVEHRGCAVDEAQILLCEPSGTVTAGNVTHAGFTASTGIVI